MAPKGKAKALVLQVGDRVKVAKTIKTISETPVDLPIGIEGTIIEIDADGDAYIAFAGIDLVDWIDKEDLGNLIKQAERKEKQKRADKAKHAFEEKKKLMEEAEQAKEKSAEVLGRLQNLFSNMGPECAYLLDKFNAFVDIPVLGRCIRISDSFDLTEREILLTHDGRILAKKVHRDGYFGHHYEESVKWEISEGTYEVVDPRTFSVKVEWQAWAEAKASYDSGVNHGEVERSDWQLKVLPALSMVPNHGHVTNVLEASQEMLKDMRGEAFGQKGMRMEGATPDLVTKLQMKPDNAWFWQFGETSPSVEWG